ncbi:MAG: tetratricopeptide repeat protein [Bacteroidetes bacterium]|jgi:tetratricopeptide (TPR) repeat protein|nr:tetratricopeptide repeat protein [Bacteroidota bacterium]
MRPISGLKSILLFTFLWIGLYQQGTAQMPVLIQDESFRADAVEAIDSLYNRNADASRDILADWKDRYPGHPIWSVWRAMEIWWDVLDDLYDTSKDDELLEALQRSDFEAGQLLNRQPNHPDALIIRALANGYAARHYSNREEWITSLRIARKAYKAYQQLIEVEPNFEDNEFVLGMISYYSAYIPQEYPVVKTVSWFLPDGDRKEGLEKIDYAAREGVFARPEATYFMGNILLNYEQEYQKALIYFRKLTTSYPDNGYYRRLLVRTMASQHQNSDVLRTVESTMNYWQKRGRTDDHVMIEEMRFWQGIAHYRLGSYKEALQSFKTSIESGSVLPNRSKRLYYGGANYYAGLTSEALNQQEKARQFYTEAAKQNSSSTFEAKSKERLKAL